MEEKIENEMETWNVQIYRIASTGLREVKRWGAEIDMAAVTAGGQTLGSKEIMCLIC